MHLTQFIVGENILNFVYIIKKIVLMKCITFGEDHCWTVALTAKGQNYWTPLVYKIIKCGMSTKYLITHAYKLPEVAPPVPVPFPVPLI